MKKSFLFYAIFTLIFSFEMGVFSAEEETPQNLKIQAITITDAGEIVGTITDAFDRVVSSDALFKSSKNFKTGASVATTISTSAMNIAEGISNAQNTVEVLDTIARELTSVAGGKLKSELLSKAGEKITSVAAYNQVTGAVELLEFTYDAGYWTVYVITTSLPDSWLEKMSKSEITDDIAKTVDFIHYWAIENPKEVLAPVIAPVQNAVDSMKSAFKKTSERWINRAVDAITGAPSDADDFYKRAKLQQQGKPKIEFIDISNYPETAELLDMNNTEPFTYAMLKEDYYFLDLAGNIQKIPAGFIFDGASIPDKTKYFIEGNSYDPDILRSGLIHDFQYRNPDKFSKDEADYLFYRNLKEDGAPRPYILLAGVRTSVGDAAYERHVENQESGKYDLFNDEYYKRNLQIQQEEKKAREENNSGKEDDHNQKPQTDNNENNNKSGNKEELNDDSNGQNREDSSTQGSGDSNSETGDANKGGNSRSDETGDNSEGNKGENDNSNDNESENNGSDNDENSDTTEPDLNFPAPIDIVDLPDVDLSLPCLIYPSFEYPRVLWMLSGESTTSAIKDVMDQFSGDKK